MWQVGALSFSKSAMASQPKPSQEPLFAGFFNKNLELKPGVDEIFIQKTSLADVDARSAAILSTLSSVKDMDALSLKPVAPTDIWFLNDFKERPNVAGNFYKGSVDGITVEVIDENLGEKYMIRTVVLYKTGEAGKKGTTVVHMENHKEDPAGAMKTFSPSISVIMKDNSLVDYGLHFRVEGHDRVESAEAAYERLKPFLTKVEEVIPDPSWIPVQ